MRKRLLALEKTGDCEPEGGKGTAVVACDGGFAWLEEIGRVTER